MVYYSLNLRTFITILFVDKYFTYWLDIFKLFLKCSAWFGHELCLDIYLAQCITVSTDAEDWPRILPEMILACSESSKMISQVVFMNPIPFRNEMKLIDMD